MAIECDRTRINRIFAIFILIGIFSIIAVLSGCASTAQRTIAKRNAFHPTKPEQIEFLADSAVVDREYVDLGTTEIKISRKKQAGWTMEQIQNRMRDWAASLGAEAVIGLSVDSLNEKGKVENKITFTGTAVRFIDIYTIGDIPNEKYEILGKVWVSHKGSSLNAGTRDRILREIKPLAANLGANAILGFYASIQDNDEKMTFGCWGSGLAIKYIDSDSAMRNNRTNYIVGIRPWTYLNGDEKNPRIYLGDLVSTARYYLEQKGYYAFVSESPIPLYYLDKLDSVRADPNGKANELQMLYGPDTELILLLDLTESPDKISTTPDSASFRARLFSKSDQKIIWDYSIKIDKGILARLYDGARGRGDFNLGAMQLYDAAQLLFSNIPARTLADSRIKNDRFQTSGDTLPDKSGNAVYTQMQGMFDQAESFLLYEAVSDNNLSLIKEMLKRGADINSRGYNDYTLLHTAVANGYVETTEFLLENGADSGLKDGNGLTPLQLAQKMEKDGFDMTAVIRLLPLKAVTSSGKS